MLDSLGKLLDAILGPGSEWFWAAAQFVVVVISLAGIYHQLRAQGSANTFHQMATLHERWDSERLMRARLALALHFRHVKDDDVPPMTFAIADFFEDIAMLQDGGHLSRKDVWLDWNRTVEIWWTILAPAVQQRRLLYTPSDFEGFERLNALMRKLDRTAGQVNEFDPVTISRILDDLIVYVTASLRLDQEARAGIIPTAPERSASAKT